MKFKAHRVILNYSDRLGGNIQNGVQHFVQLPQIKADQCYVNVETFVVDNDDNNKIADQFAYNVHIREFVQPNTIYGGSGGNIGDIVLTTNNSYNNGFSAESSMDFAVPRSVLNGCLNVYFTFPSTQSSVNYIRNFTDSNTLVEFPPSSLGASNVILTSPQLGMGRYIVDASSTALVSLASWKAFDKDINTAWACRSDGAYNASSPYNYLGSTATNVSGSNVLGEWLQLKVPCPVRIASYTITPRQDGTEYQRSPQDFILCGSVDGTKFESIDIRTTETGWTKTARTYTLASVSPKAYYFFRLLCRKTVFRFDVGELQLYGYIAPMIKNYSMTLVVKEPIE